LNGQSVTVTTTWTRFSVTLTLPSVAGKTLGTAGDDATFVNFWFSSGATQNVRSGSVGVQSGTIQLWGVQLEIGSAMTPLEKPDPQQDIAKCQRFYQTSPFSSYGAGSNGPSLRVPIPLVVQMRAAPTVAPNFTGTPGLTSPGMIAVGAGMLTLTATENTASYGADGVYTASADL
jgi:hypothetical protein